LDPFNPGEYRRFKGTIEIARVDFADRDANLADCVAKRSGQLLALLVEVSLFGDVIEIEGVGIGLIREGCTMPDNNHVSARTQRLHYLFLVSDRDLLTQRLRQRRSSQCQCQASSQN